jgi:hypothetical protein
MPKGEVSETEGATGRIEGRMTLQERLQRQFDNCTGPAPKQFVLPKPKSGIAKHFESQKLEEIEVEYREWFDREKGR